ncbi:MAG: fumarylacetoacetate hydrolase family protein [Haliangiales bacterium]
MQYVISPPTIPAVAVAGTDAQFPVRRIYCVGRNYAAHAREMGSDPDREPPFFFTKAPDSVLPSGAAFPYPPASDNVHHEIELVVALASGGSDIAADDALACIYGYAVGLDMTRRDVQGALKKSGRPWEAAKAFEHAAPCGAIQPAATIGHPKEGAIWLDVDGERRQQGDLADLIWSVPEIICELSKLFRLAAGDLIYTGTPAGVGPVSRGQRMRGGIDGVGELDIEVV